jgi:hypothetical protein
MDTILEYGKRILFPCFPITEVIPIFGISIKSYGGNDKPDLVEMEIQKYWEDDTDANSFKVKLVPVSDEDKARYGSEKIYSMDLRSMLSDPFSEVKFVE